MPRRARRAFHPFTPPTSQFGYVFPDSVKDNQPHTIPVRFPDTNLDLTGSPFTLQCAGTTRIPAHQRRCVRVVPERRSNCRRYRAYHSGFHRRLADLEDPRPRRNRRLRNPHYARAQSDRRDFRQLPAVTIPLRSLIPILCITAWPRCPSMSASMA